MTTCPLSPRHQLETIQHDRSTNFYLCPITVLPKSRGKLSLHSADPLSPPKIQMNCLQDEQDFLPLLTGIQLAHELAKSVAFNGLLGKEISLTSHLAKDTELENFIRQTATTL